MRADRADDPVGPQRTDRQVGWLISLGGAILVVGQAATGFWGSGAYPPWWSIGGILMALTVVCFAVAGRFLPFGVLRVGWIGVPVAGAILWLAVFAGYRGDPADASLPWIWALQPVVASYPVLWARPVIAVVLAVVSGLLPAVSALVFFGWVPEILIVATPIHLANIAFVAIFVGIRGRLNRLRRSERDARAQDDRSARAFTEARRQARLGRLIHDEVLSVLSAARTFDGVPPTQLRSEAAHARLLLEELPPAAQLDLRACDDAIAAITAALRRIDPACALATAAPGAGGVPGAAVETVTLAAAEALRNSLRHAGPESTRRLRVRVTSSEIEVVVSDDGTGFDPETVDSHRLGLGESIRARMSELDGGEVDISSVLGGGTEVVLTWRM